MKTAEKKFEIVPAQGKTRLTITPERITLKVKESLSEAEIEKLKTLAISASDRLGEIKTTWRGSPNVRGVFMKTEHNAAGHFIEYENS